MPTILVTGGAGIIGGCFMRQLLAETDTRVVNLDRRPTPAIATRSARWPITRSIGSSKATSATARWWRGCSSGIGPTRW
jgi:nucleoside-diphosphate-sugar epimerase